MIRRFRTVVVGSYLNGVYRPVRVIQIPYSIPYPLGRAQTVAAGAGEVLVQGGAVSLSLQGVPAVEADHGGSGGQFEWFERRNREDEIILQVIAEFLKAA